ncbi:MAG: type I 3-dehydroquinate dehydratase [Bacteroidales bacterium]|nr:MAG: type I 3-dehydroquinate dehydratase [Bacteroidales bacterium]
MICVAISDKNIDNCLATLKNVEMAEIRLDLTEFNLDEIKKVFSLQKKLIATHRPDKHTEEERMKNLKAAIKAGAKYLDLEYESNEIYRKEMISYAHSNNCDVVISYHNYENTPDLEVLKIILKNSFEFGADIAKIVATAITNIDNAKILSLYNYPGRIIAFCMGNMGKITRIIAPFMGAEFTYAAMDEGEATAAGQIKYSNIKNIIQNIENSIG